MNNRPVFFEDLVGLITTARIVAKTRNVSLAEASDYLDRLLARDGTLIYTMVAEHQVEELGEAWYAPACDYVSEALSHNWWCRPKILAEPLLPLGVLRDELAISNLDAVRLLGIVGDGSDGTTITRHGDSDGGEITGPTFDRLQRAIAAFPTRYPNYKSKFPKLENDVRPWLEETGLGKNTSERLVFAAIIAEHFKFSPDTLNHL